MGRGALEPHRTRVFVGERATSGRLSGSSRSFELLESHMDFFLRNFEAAQQQARSLTLSASQSAKGIAEQISEHTKTFAEQAATASSAAAEQAGQRWKGLNIQESLQLRALQQQRATAGGKILCLSGFVRPMNFVLLHTRKADQPASYKHWHSQAFPAKSWNSMPSLRNFKTLFEASPTPHFVISRWSSCLESIKKRAKRH